MRKSLKYCFICFVAIIGFIKVSFGAVDVYAQQTDTVSAELIPLTSERSPEYINGSGTPGYYHQFTGPIPGDFTTTGLENMYTGYDVHLDENLKCLDGTEPHVKKVVSTTEVIFADPNIAADQNDTLDGFRYGDIYLPNATSVFTRFSYPSNGDLGTLGISKEWIPSLTIGVFNTGDDGVTLAPKPFSVYIFHRRYGKYGPPPNQQPFTVTTKLPEVQVTFDCVVETEYAGNTNGNNNNGNLPPTDNGTPNIQKNEPIAIKVARTGAGIMVAGVALSGMFFTGYISYKKALQ